MHSRIPQKKKKKKKFKKVCAISGKIISNVPKAKSEEKSGKWKKRLLAAFT